MFVRFLGASVLPFCDIFVFAGPIQLVHCDACSTQVKPRGSEVPRYLVSSEKFAVLGFTVTHACCTGPAKQNGSAPVPGNGMSVAASSVLLTISDSIFKVITVKKQIRMCNYKIFYGNYFDIHFQYRQKVYISEKVNMAIFFQWQYQQYRQIEISQKTIYRNTDGA